MSGHGKKVFPLYSPLSIKDVIEGCYFDLDIARTFRGGLLKIETQLAFGSSRPYSGPRWSDTCYHFVKSFINSATESALIVSKTY